MDPQALFAFFQDLANSIFGTKTGTVILNIAAVLVFVYFVLWFIAKTKDLIVSNFLPLFYKPDERRRAERRRRFAEHTESEIKRLNRLEEWSDYRFTELEAEVEAEGDWTGKTFIPFIMRRRAGLRREESLSTALANSRERLILLQGEPGSGKSVALRHIVQKISSEATRKPSLTSTIPIYINLKELHRLPNQKIDRQLVQGFILQSLNRVNDRDIEMFLDEEFESGLREARWLFLFDSFDELPEVLGSTHSDQIIYDYSTAISDFLHGMNRCRGIVASRHFRGPEHIGWPKFTILALTETRRRELIRRAELSKNSEELLIGGLGLAPVALVTMSANPMFMSLLCDHMKAGKPFPANSHILFESYIETRLSRDAERIKKRFNFEVGELRTIAEQIAFTMAANDELGLSPSRENLHYAMQNLGFDRGNSLDRALDALEYIKLGRSENALSAVAGKLFTFAHRRFQEYFATCVVLDSPHLISTRRLLTDGRWRETAVTMCQTQSTENLKGLYEEADALLAELIGNREDLIENPLEYIDAQPPQVQQDSVKSFDLPELYFHILSVLQDGLLKRKSELPDSLVNRASKVILSILVGGTLFERKWILEVLGIAYDKVIVWGLVSAFKSKFSVLKDIAYTQSNKTTEMTPELRYEIMASLVPPLIPNPTKYFVTKAHLSRLPNADVFIEYFDITYRLTFRSILLLVLLIGFLVAFEFYNGNPSFMNSWATLFILFGLLSIFSSSFVYGEHLKSTGETIGKPARFFTIYILAYRYISKSIKEFFITNKIWEQAYFDLQNNKLPILVSATKKSMGIVLYLSSIPLTLFLVYLAGLWVNSLEANDFKAPVWLPKLFLVLVIIPWLYLIVLIWNAQKPGFAFLGLRREISLKSLIKYFKSAATLRLFKKNFSEFNGFNDFLSAIHQLENSDHAVKFLGLVRRKKLLPATLDTKEALTVFCTHFESEYLQRIATINSFRLPRNFKGQEASPSTPEEWNKYAKKINYQKMELDSRNPLTGTSYLILEASVLEELTLLLDQVRVGVKQQSTTVKITS